MADPRQYTEQFTELLSRSIAIGCRRAGSAISMSGGIDFQHHGGLRPRRRAATARG